MSCDTKNPSNYISTLVTATTAGVVLSAFDENRTALILFNQGPEVARLYFDANSTIYFELAVGDGMDFPAVPINGVSAKTASGTTVVSVLEG